MRTRSRSRRVLNLAVVAALGVALGVGGFIAIQVLNRPGPRAAADWLQLAELPDPRGETSAAAVDDQLFVVGGLEGLVAQPSDLVSVYDSAHGRWRAGLPLPEARHHAAATELDGSVYVSGGASTAGDWRAADTLWVLEPDAFSWRALAPMPDARYGHRMVVLGSRLYVVGGIPSGNAVGGGGVVLVYDPGLDSWSFGAPLPVNRDHLAVVVVDDEIWAIGGRAGGINDARVDIYDPATDTWREGPPLPEATSGAAEAFIAGVILVSGGEDPGAGTLIDRHWWLDTLAAGTPTWQPLEPPPYTVHGAPGAVLRGRFVIVGGALRAGGRSSTAWTGATQLLQELP